MAVRTSKQPNNGAKERVDWEKANANPAGRLKLAHDMYEMGVDAGLDMQQRLDALRQAARLDPFQLSYRLALAELEAQASLYEQAVETYRECREYWPDNRIVSISLGEAYLESGNVGKAREFFKPSETPEKDKFLYRLAFDLIECDLREGKWAEAIEGLEKLDLPNRSDEAESFFEKCVKIALENTDRGLLDKVLAMADGKIPEQARSGNPKLKQLRKLLERLVKFDPAQETELSKSDDFEGLLLTYKLSRLAPLQVGSADENLVALAAWQKRLDDAGNKPGALPEAYLSLLDGWAQQAYRSKELRLANVLWSEAERLCPWQPEIVQNLAILHTRMKDENGYRWYWDKASRAWVFFGETMPEAEGYKQNLILKHRAFIEGAQAKCPALQDWRQLLELGAAWAKEAVSYFALAQIEFRNAYHRLGLQKSDFSGDEERKEAIDTAYSVMCCWLEQVAAWEGLGKDSALAGWRTRRLDEAKEALAARSPSAIGFYEDEQKAFTAMRELMTTQYLYLFFRIVPAAAEKVKLDDARAMESYAALAKPFLTFPHALLKPGVLKAVEQLKPETDLRTLAQNHVAVPWVSAAQAYMEKGQAAKAEPALNQMLEVMPDFVPGMFLLARCLSDQENFDRAFEVLDRARKLVKPGDEYEEHIEKFSRQMDTARVGKRLKKAQDLLQKDDAAGALAECNNALKAYPGHPYVLFVMAQAYLAKAEIAAAKNALTKARGACEGNDELGEAIKNNQEQIEKQGADIILSKAAGEMNAERWKPAIAYLENGREITPPDARISYYMAICHFRLDQMDQAEACARRGLEEYGNNPSDKTAQVKGQLNDLLKAVSQARRRIVMNPIIEAINREDYTLAIQKLDALMQDEEAERNRQREKERQKEREEEEKERKMNEELEKRMKLHPNMARPIKQLQMRRPFHLDSLLEPIDAEAIFLRAMCKFRAVMKKINSRSVTPSPTLFDDATADLDMLKWCMDDAVKKQAESLRMNIDMVKGQLRDAGYYY